MSKKVLIAVMMSLVLSLVIGFEGGAIGSSDLGERIDDLGKLATDYPISEKNLFDELVEAGTSERGMKIQDEFLQKTKSGAKEYASRPGGRSLPLARKDRTLVFDPSITLLEDIRDSSGKVIHRAGTLVNPLSHIQYQTTLCFLDGTDGKQLQWINNNCPLSINSKVILVDGDISLASEKLKRRVYYDQKSDLIAKFGISALPAMVKQEGQLLLVREIAIK